MEYVGFYMDTDIINIKNLDILLDFPGAGAQTSSELANGLLNFPKNHEFLGNVIKEFANDYSPECWACKGPVLISKVFRDYCNSTNFIQTHQLTKDKIIKYKTNP